jgi:DNA-binding response OmpR family regulator
MTIKKFTIFALDDDEMFCALLVSLAKRADFISAVDGYVLNLVAFNNMKNLDAAVAYIKNTKPDLVLLDYYLLPWGCLGSIGILEKIIPYCGSRTTIILMTGMHPEDSRFKLIKEAVGKMSIGIIQKPFSIAELLVLIKTSIRKKENV